MVNRLGHCFFQNTIFIIIILIPELAAISSRNSAWSKEFWNVSAPVYLLLYLLYLLYIITYYYCCYYHIYIWKKFWNVSALVYSLIFEVTVEQTCLRICHNFDFKRNSRKPVPYCLFIVPSIQNHYIENFWELVATVLARRSISSLTMEISRDCGPSTQPQTSVP